MSQINYLLKRSAKRKTLAIKIENYTAQVIVYAPQGMSLEKINCFVDEKSEWIKSHSDLVKSRNGVLPKIQSGNNIYIAGKNYTLNICEINRASVNGQIINLPIGREKESLIRIAKKLFVSYAKEYTEIIAKNYAFTYRSVSVGSAKTRWGSCTVANDIIYSVGLAFLPFELCEYVIVHELCHTRQKNHGKQFYSLVKRCMPDYKARALRLKNYSAFLHFLKNG